MLAELRRRIVMNELAPGAVLTEAGLSAELGCSQSSVREALLRLEGEGLVLRSGQQGTTVTDLDLASATELLDLRRRLELRGARGAVCRFSASDLALLAAIQQRMERAAAEDAWAVLEPDMELHLALFRASGLFAMIPILAWVMIYSHRFRLWAPWHKRSLVETALRHRPILAALSTSDAAALTRELTAHLDTMVERKLAA